MSDESEYLRPWLRKIGRLVDDLVRKPRIAAYFRRMVGLWKRERNRQPTEKEENVKGRKAREYRPDLPIPLPKRRLSKPEQFAIMLAIRDRVRETAPAVDPWSDKDDRGPQRGRFGAVAPYAGTAYYGLIALVPELNVDALTDGFEPVRAVFLDVLQDLSGAKLLTEKEYEAVKAEVNAIVADVQREQEDGDSFGVKVERITGDLVDDHSTPVPSPLAPSQPHISQPVIDPVDHAVAILFREPEISPDDLARLVGVNRSTLYRKSKKWKPVRDTLLAKGNPTDHVKGTKSSSGHIEAES